MKRRVFLSLALVLAPGCLGDIDPAWQLDHDRIVAVRMTPPHIPVGKIAMIDALIAHKGAPTDLEAPIEATAAPANPPADLFTAVHFDLTHWEIDGTLVTEAQLADARTALKLDPAAPVPLDVTVQFPDSNGLHLFANKLVYLGDARDNPAMPPVMIAGAPPGSDITVPIDMDVQMSVAVDPMWKVSWFSSCGTMHDEDEPAAFLHVLPADPKTGELAVVVRDPFGGVVWQVWPIHAQ